MSGSTRPPFRRSYVPGAIRAAPGRSRARKRARHCLAASSPANLFRGPQLLLKRLSQSPAFQTPGYQPGTAEPPAAAVDLPGLVMVSAMMLTLLGGPTSGPSLYVSTFRPSIVSAGTAGDFWGSKLEASPYPRAMIVRDSVPSPSQLTPKRFRAFHG